MSGKNEELDLSQAVWGDVKALDYSLAVLPWGATEPHNLHLPYLTDCYLAKGIALDAAEKVYKETGLRVMVLPAMFMGSQNQGQWNLPFCIHTKTETQKAILSDIVASLHVQGMRRLVIVNGHGGNTMKGILRDLSFDYPDFDIVWVDWFSVVPQEGYFENKDEHAGELETSVMMHYYPELIDLKKAGAGEVKPFGVDSLNAKTGWLPRNWSRVTNDTGIGNPFKASAEKGKRYSEVVVGKLTKLYIDLAVQKDLYSK